MKLNLDVNGHRLADFPHALYFKGAMTDVDWPCLRAGYEVWLRSENFDGDGRQRSKLAFL